MMLTEDILAWVPGFYALAVSTAIYLMLPMFSGADQVFRKFLVPIFGLEKELAKADVGRIVAEIGRKLPQNQQDELRSELSSIVQSHGKKGQ